MHKWGLNEIIQTHKPMKRLCFHFFMIMGFVFSSQAQKTESIYQAQYPCDWRGYDGKTITGNNYIYFRGFGTYLNPHNRDYSLNLNNLHLFRGGLSQSNNNFLSNIKRISG